VAWAASHEADHPNSLCSPQHWGAGGAILTYPEDLPRILPADRLKRLPIEPQLAKHPGEPARRLRLALDDPRAADWFAAAFDRDWAVASPL